MKALRIDVELFEAVFVESETVQMDVRMTMMVQNGGVDDGG